MAKDLRTRDYLKRWAKMAFLSAPTVVDLWTGIIGLVFSGIGVAVPKWDPIVQEWLPLVLLGAAAFVLLARMVMAPFWLAQEDDAEIAKLKADAETRKRRLNAKERLGELIAKGNEILKLAGRESTPERQILMLNKAFRKEATSYIESTFGNGEAALFNSTTGQTRYSGSGPNPRVRSNMEFAVMRLSELLLRADSIELADHGGENE